MKFYNRANDIGLLKKIEQDSLENAQMTFLVGRRRIGKTSLLLEAYKESETLYFFIAQSEKKSAEN